MKGFRKLGEPLFNAGLTARYLLGSRQTAGGAAPVTPPAQPTGLSATPITTARIDLAWTDVATTETAYKVYRSTDGVNYAQVGTDQAADANSYSDTTVTAGTKYYYKVAAVNVGGETLSAAATATTLSLSVIDYWKLDETSGNRQNSVSTRHLLVNGTVGNTTGKIGNCATFVTGAGNFLQATATNDLLAYDWNSGFTVTGWMYIPSALATISLMLGKYVGGSLDWELTMFALNSTRMTVNGSTSGSTAIITTALNVDTWYFLAGRYNPSTKKAEISFNGGSWFLGSALVGNVLNNRNIYGVNNWAGVYGTSRVDETGVWTRYLSDAEIAALYNGGTGLTHPF